MTDLSCLSRDELIALLQKKEEEAAAANAKLVTAETKASEAEAKASRAEVKANEAEAQANQAKAIARQAEEKVIQAEKRAQQVEEKFVRVRHNYYQLAKGTIHLINSVNAVKADYAKQVEQYLLGLDDEFAKTALNAVLRYVQDSRKILASNQRQIVTFFSKGNEAFTSVQQAETSVAKSLTELKKAPSFSNNVKAIGTALELLHKAVVSLDNTKQSAARIQKNLEGIKKRLNVRSEKQKTEQGRVNNFENLDKQPGIVAGRGISSMRCPECGCEITDLKTALVKIKVQADALLNHKAFGQCNGYQVGFCSNCGKVHVLMEPGQDHPLFPERQISTRSMIAWNESVCAGIPLEKAIRHFEKEAELGSNTCSYSLYDYQRIYLKPLYLELKKKLQNQPIVLCDETPFDCLQDQGRGKAAANQPKSCKSTTNYIVTMTSADSSEEPITLYSYSPTRSAENIGKVLAGFKFKTLVTDGYTGYETLLRERLNLKEDEPVLHQSCLVHLRRQILLTVLPSDHFKQLMKMPEHKPLGILKERLENNADGIKLLTALDLIGCVFRLRTLMRDGTLSIRESMSGQTQLMDWLDELMMELKEGLVQKKGARWVKSKDHPNAKVCVYYLNARDELRTFLTDPAIPPCTNKVERAIRAVTVLRKNSLFKHSPDFMNTLCIGLSVNATLLANGIENTSEFLTEYSQALYKHMLEKGLELKWKETGQQKTSFSICSEKRAEQDSQSPYLPEKLAEGFNMNPWLNRIFNRKA